MNERERQICARLREIRERAQRSRLLFASLLRVTHDKLASIEYARTPLRAETAISFAKLTGCNLNWLAEGNGPVFGALPSPDFIEKIPPRWMFSHAWEKYLKIALPRGAKQFGEPLTEWGEIHGANSKEYCEEEIQGVLKFLPPELHWNFYSHLSKACRNFVAMNQAKITESSAAEKFSKKDLTTTSLKSKSAAVKSEVEKLIARVNLHTSRPGSKSELARTLNVAPARISEWLSGEKEPGGEYTLQLLHWVEHQECKQ